MAKTPLISFSMLKALKDNNVRNLVDMHPEEYDLYFNQAADANHNTLSSMYRAIHKLEQKYPEEYKMLKDQNKQRKQREWDSLTEQQRDYLKKYARQQKMTKP